MIKLPNRYSLIVEFLNSSKIVKGIVDWFVNESFSINFKMSESEILI